MFPMFIVMTIFGNHLDESFTKEQSLVSYVMTNFWSHLDESFIKE